MRRLIAALTLRCLNGMMRASWATYQAAERAAKRVIRWGLQGEDEGKE